VAENVVDACRRFWPVLCLSASPVFGFTGGAVDPDAWLTISPRPKRLHDNRSSIRVPKRRRAIVVLTEVNVQSIDEQPKEAAISLLRTIAYHKRHSRRAEERDLEERLRYHEASRKDAEELLALYQRRWPEEAAVGGLEYVEATPAEAGNSPS
jgi:hypothetical protein